MQRFQIVDSSKRKHKTIMPFLPKKSTKGSSGYDFYSLETRYIPPKEKHTFWTDVKVKLFDDETLIIIPRSSVGDTKNLMLANTIGNIDPDYYGNEKNDGNIGIRFYNYGDQTSVISKGERIAQGIVVKIAQCNGGIASEIRKGGFGSTGV